MIEVAPSLYVGHQADYEKHVEASYGEVKDGWAVVHACKEPFHRDAVGYTGRACSSEHKEYLVARRGDRLCLNMVDAPKPEFFRPEMIDAALEFIQEQRAAGNKVLSHCNQGCSRGPSLALLYLRKHSTEFTDMAFEEAEDVFRGLYPAYAPANGIREYVRRQWGA